MQPAERTWLRHCAIIGALIALTFAIYGQVHDHDFVNIDDPIYIVDNPNLVAGLSFDAVKRAFSEPYETNWIPLTWISLSIDHALFGLDPTGYHLENVALHALSACLLYLALWRMTGSRWRSAWVAAVFAVHPLHVESVAWATERKDALSGVFWMLTLLSYVYYCERADRSKTPGAWPASGSIGRYSLVIVCFVLGLLAKPMAVMLPLVLLLLDYWPLGRLKAGVATALPDPIRLKRAIVEKLPLVAIAAAIGAVTVAVQSDAGAVLRGDLLSVRLRVMNALNSYVAYIADSFWPTNLSIFYPHPMGRASGWLATTQAMGLALATAGFARIARTRPYWIVGWLWYLLALLPVIGLVQVGLQARADRYTYLTQIGLTIALAWGAHDLLGRTLAGRKALALVGVGSIIGLSIAASLQAAHWRNSLSLYEQAVAANDASPIALLGLAGLMVQSNRIDEAEAYYTRALEISPGMAGAHAGLGDVLSLKGRFDLAIESYRRALQRFPRRARWRAHLGKALVEDGQAKAAIDELESAIKLYRDQRTPEVHAYLASALAQDGQLERARRQYLKAIALRPAYADAHANLGFVLIRQQRHQEAQTHLERALELDAETAELHAGLGDTSAKLGKPAEAKHHYGAALRLRPGWPVAANNLAWILATHPDPQVRDAEQALRIAETLTQAHPTFLDTVAAAQAANGRFDDARRNVTAAVALARDAGEHEFVRELESRLTLYREDQPFIESLPTAD